jgi:hypothetical protein
MISKFFHELAAHRRVVEKHKNLFSLFLTAFDITDNNQRIPFLQKEFILTEILYAYLHFGFGLFGDIGSILIQEGLFQLAQCDKSFVETYLFHIKAFIEQEVNVESTGPFFSENTLDASFCCEFIKRIFSTEASEDMRTGMILFSPTHVEKLRSLARDAIRHTQGHSEPNLWLDHSTWEAFPWEPMRNEFVYFLKEVRCDALILIMRRFECFLKYLSDDPQKQDTLFLFRQPHGEKEPTAKKLTALLTLFLNHEQDNGKALFQKGMRTSKDLVHVFHNPPEGFCLEGLEKWLNVREKAQIKSLIEVLLEEAVQSGMLFRVPQGKHNYEFGLTDSGMAILHPYQDVLKETLRY